VARLNEQLRDNLQYLYDLWAATGWAFNYVPNGDFIGWQAGTSSAPDAWTLVGTDAAVAREGSIIKLGVYSAKLTNGASNAAYLSQTLPAEWVKQQRNKTVSIGCWVRAGAANRARIRVYDGTNYGDSAYHTGNSTWQWLTATLTVGASATALTVYCDLVAGAAISVYYQGFVLAPVEAGAAFVQGPNDIFPRLAWRQDTTPANFRLGGGLLMQCGQHPSGTANVVITFPVAFSQTPFLVIVVSNWRSLRTPEAVSATGFTSYQASGASTGGYWIAIGVE